MNQIDHFAYSGSPEAMTAVDMERVYGELPFEVHTLVDTMLSASGDRIETDSAFIDTPALAVQALRVNVGRDLHVYGKPLIGDGSEAIGIRPVTAEDLFAIAEGPTPVGSGIFSFRTILERVATSEAQPAARSREALETVFHMFASAR